MEKRIEYTLTMNSSQARETMKAVELLMRLKINQPEEIARAVMPDDYWDDKHNKVDNQKFDDYLRRRDAAYGYLRLAFRQIFPEWDRVKKDEEWYRLYNLYQVLRKAIHDAEHPATTGVDSYPPVNLGGLGEKMPECAWREKEDRA